MLAWANTLVALSHYCGELDHVGRERTLPQGPELRCIINKKGAAAAVPSLPRLWSWHVMKLSALQGPEVLLLQYLFLQYNRLADYLTT